MDVPDQDLVHVLAPTMVWDNNVRVGLTQQIITPPVITFGVIYGVRVTKVTPHTEKPVPVPG